MADEQKESRIKVEDLPQPEQELTAEEIKKVRGGAESKNTQTQSLGQLLAIVGTTLVKSIENPQTPVESAPQKAPEKN